MIIEIVSKTEIKVDGVIWVRPPVKKKKKPSLKKPPTEKALKLAKEVQAFFPIQFNLEKAAYDFDRLMIIDGHEETTITVVCERIRKHHFWSKNFQSPMKLRKKDKDGTMYILKFMEILKAEQNEQKERTTSSTNRTSGAGVSADYATAILERMESKN